MDVKGSDSVVIGSTDAYRIVAEELAGAGLPMGLAELHGSLCGVMCSGGVAASRAWLQQCLDDCGQVREQMERPRAALAELELDTWRTLTGSEMSFAPLLPDDDEALEQRLQALAAWCRGFVTGLGLGGLQLTGDDQRDSDELNEIVGDFIEISRVTLESHDAQDEIEADFSLTELTEYVRVCVQIVYEELLQRRDRGTEERVH